MSRTVRLYAISTIGVWEMLFSIGGIPLLWILLDFLASIRVKHALWPIHTAYLWEENRVRNDADPFNIDYTWCTMDNNHNN